MIIYIYTYVSADWFLQACNSHSQRGGGTAQVPEWLRKRVAEQNAGASKTSGASDLSYIIYCVYIYICTGILRVMLDIHMYVIIGFYDMYIYIYI